MDSETTTATMVETPAAEWRMKGTVADKAAAFRQLADEHLDASYGLAGAILRDPAEARDAVHDAASIALFGALALALPLGPRQEDPAPAEAPALGEIRPYAGEMRILGQDHAGSTERFDWGHSTMGEQWTTRLTTDDPRYSGVWTGFHNYYEVDPGDLFVRGHNSRLFTKDEDGTWLATGYGYRDPETSNVTYVTHATGEGTYDGLSAYGICEQEGQSSAHMECHGIVFEGEWPELPAEAPDEIPAIHLEP